MQSRLIKPKEISIECEIDGTTEVYNYAIGRYPALDSLELINFGQDFLLSMGENGISRDGVLKKYVLKMGKFIERIVTKDDGTVVFVSLANESVLNANLPAFAELTIKLMIELHDYNTLFLKLGKVYQQYQNSITNIDLLVQEM